jgi:hypothetical protein
MVEGLLGWVFAAGLVLPHQGLPQKLGNDFANADIFLACDLFGGAQNVHFNIECGSHDLLRDDAAAAS